MKDPTLPDVLEVNLRAVFCGTAAGTKSMERRAYYAGPGNRFWDVLYEAGITRSRLTPDQYRDIRMARCGLTDIAKKSHGADRRLRPADFDVPALKRRLEQFHPVVVAFNGKKAAQLALGFASTKHVRYGRQAEVLCGVEVWVMPSTSAQASRYWDPRVWKALGRRLRLIG